MENIVEKMNFAINAFEKKNAPTKAITIDPRRDINYYETLCLYCADNDINLDKVSDEEFENAADFLENFASDFRCREDYDSIDNTSFKFWID